LDDVYIRVLRVHSPFKRMFIKFLSWKWMGPFLIKNLNLPLWQREPISKVSRE
jgi:hypothetical protein